MSETPAPDEALAAQPAAEPADATAAVDAPGEAGEAGVAPSPPEGEAGTPPAEEPSVEAPALETPLEAPPDAPPAEVSDPAQQASEVVARGDAERGKLARRAAIVGAGTLASRLLGLARDVALAAMFTRAETDAFFTAFRIPNALRQLLGEGAVSSAVVPVLAKKLETEGEEPARDFFAKARGVSLLALAVVTVLGMLLAEPLTELFAGGYHAQPGQFERTVSLTRTVFPYIFFMGSAALGMAALNANKRFAVAAFAPALLNVAFLIAAFVLPAVFLSLGVDAAQAIVAGALLGGVLQVAAQWPSLRKLGYAGLPQIDFNDPAVRDMLRRMGPMAFGLGVYYIDMILSTRFLSELGPGAQSYFMWASRLCDFPQGIFVLALSTASLPSLAGFAARGEMAELEKTYAHGMKLSLFVAIPSSVALMALAEPLIVLLFQRGHFQQEASHETARALLWQGGAVWTVAAVRQIVPVYYALGDTRTPVVVSALDLLAFIALALALRGPLGHVGVSVAVAGSSFVQMALLLVFLRRKLADTRLGDIARSAGKSLLAAIVAGVGGAHAAELVAGVAGEGTVARLLPGLGGAVVFAGLYVLAAYGLRSAELEGLTAGVRRRLARGARAA
ncbi:MAG: murein biosynthesis integral membrane protein MurJ [Myxococcales bacterium]|nr:murein biosynthesis integral membrane protein MurJ [Myxococcales bacterium]